MALDEDTVRLAKGQNLARDPRITVLIQSNDDPWDWSEVRGHVVRTLTGEQARQHIDEVSQRYTGHAYAPPVGPEGRIVYVVAPDKVNTPKSLGRR